MNKDFDFFKMFKKELKEAIIGDYLSLKVLFNNETPYCCALVTDSDASTIFFAINTIERYNDKINKVGEKYKAYYKWTPAEWAYGDHLSNQKMVSNVSNILSKKIEEKEVKDNYSNFEISLYECMTEVLKELLEEEKYFKNMIVFISISDDKRAKAVENYSAKIINSENIYNSFIKRYEE